MNKKQGPRRLWLSLDRLILLGHVSPFGPGAASTSRGKRFCGLMAAKAFSFWPE